MSKKSTRLILETLNSHVDIWHDYKKLKKNIDKTYNTELVLGNFSYASTYKVTNPSTRMYGFYIYLPDETELTILSHELIHYLTMLFEFINIPLSSENDEILALSLQSLLKQYIEKKGLKIVKCT